MTALQNIMIGIFVGYLIRTLLDYLYNVVSKRNWDKRAKIVVIWDLILMGYWLIIYVIIREWGLH